MKQRIKEMLVTRSVSKRNKKNTFDAEKSESFSLSGDAGLDQNNSYYFSAHDQASSLFIRVGKRGGGTTELWFGYYNKNGTAYVNTQLVFLNEECPITLENVEPLKKWSVSFKGKLKKAKQNAGSLLLEPYGEDIDAVFSGIFTSNERLYDFTRDSDPSCFAKAVAREKWNKSFFKALNENTQVHLEQGGFLKGSLTVEDNTFSIDAPAMRDHSFGKRDWNYMDKHVWIMGMSDSLQLNANMVRYPALKGLKTGYYLHEGKHTNVISNDVAAITREGYCKHFRFCATLKGDKTLHNECIVNAVFKFEMGGAYTFYECVSDFLIDNDKLSARGIAEFGYNFDKQRWN